MKVKAGRPLIDIIKLCYASNTPCLVTGSAGVGKSAMLEEASREMNVEFMTLNLSLLENVDLQGIPTVKDNTTIYNPPVILPRSGRGLLSLEEINRADRSVLSCALLLLSLRKLNSYTLPPGWLPVASMNPSSDMYDVNELDNAMTTRFLKVSVEGDVKHWLKWAEKNSIHQSVCRFVRNTPNIFDSSDSTPRGWSYVSNVLRAYEQGGAVDEGLLTTGVSGLVGDALGVAFVQAHLNGEEPIPADALLRDYQRHQSTIEEWKKGKRTDLLNATAHALLVMMQNSDVCTEIEKSTVMKDSLMSFLNSLPADIAKKVRLAAKKAGALP